MNPTATDLIERQARRSTVLDRIRQIGRDGEAAVVHEFQSKAAVDPMSSPLTPAPGYWQLYDVFERNVALSRIGGAEVPFATAATVVTAAPTAYWVGFGTAKPVSASTLASVDLDPFKVASILVLTREMLRASGERADAALSRVLVNAARSAVNSALFSSAAAVPNTSPAGLGAGITAVESSGTTDDAIFADVLALLDGMAAPTLVAALPLALRIRAAFGGAEELSLVVSPEAGDVVWAIDENAVAYALGALNVTASDSAVIEMDDGPAQPAQLVSLWQSDSTALRTEVAANWEVVRSEGVAALDMGGS